MQLKAHPQHAEAMVNWITDHFRLRVLMMAVGEVVSQGPATAKK
jgi:hypothetical protein